VLRTLGSLDRSNTPPCIISIDDNGDILAARAAALQEAGYVVLSACGADEALRLLANQRNFDLLILGQAFPQAVTEWLASLLKRTSGIPVVVIVSGDSDHEIRADGYVNVTEGVEVLVSTADSVLHRGIESVKKNAAAARTDDVTG